MTFAKFTKDLFSSIPRLLALFFAIAALTLSIAALANNHWIDVYDNDAQTYILQGGLFQTCSPQFKVFHEGGTFVASAEVVISKPDFPYGYPNQVNPGAWYNVDASGNFDDFEECSLFDNVDFCRDIWKISYIANNPNTTSFAPQKGTPQGTFSSHCSEYASIQAARAFGVIHLVLIGLACVALLHLHGHFAVLKPTVILLEIVAVVGGIICMSIAYGLRTTLVTDFHTNKASAASGQNDDTKFGHYVSVNYTNGLILQTTAWILSLVALILTLFAKKPVDGEKQPVENQPATGA